MSSQNRQELKTSWTWEEWQASRAARRRTALKVAPPIVRRPQSSSDRRLRAAFTGQRGPAFGNETTGDGPKDNT